MERAEGPSRSRQPALVDGVEPSHHRGMTASPPTLRSTVAEVRELQRAAGADALVVFEGTRPVGVVSQSVLAKSAPRSLLVDVMDYEVVALSPAAGEQQTLREYTAAAWRSLKRRRPLAPETLQRRRGVTGAASHVEA